MKRLNEFIDCQYDTEIFGIKSDTRDVTPGDLFVAVKGYHVDHADFIPDALARGAVAVVTEREIQLDVPVVVVQDVNQAFFEICAKFYNKEDWTFQLVGVTGTDGKTTTATILNQLINHFASCAYFGTNGITFQENSYSSSNTTPLPEFLYSYFDKFNRENCQYVSLEVSSEALLHQRVDDLRFRYTILTNISEDHLNYHKTIENYVAAKAKLFTLLTDDGYAILNIDDRHFEEVKCKVCGQLITYGVSERADFQIQNVTECATGTTFDIVHEKEVFSIRSPFVGLYNAYNITAAFIVCYLEHYDREEVISYISSLQPVLGRGEFLDFGQNYQIVLDYAHTTNGILNILQTLKRRKHHRIITVIGSAGGREKEKRGSMGKVTLDYSDFVIFTMDDPRCEKVSDIIDDLVSESDKDHYIRIENREEAIAYAFSIAEEGDIVAILGKGRDHYMAIGNEKVDYCDYDVIEKYFSKGN